MVIDIIFDKERLLILNVIFPVAVLSLSLGLFSLAQNQKDVKALKAMTGCYDVGFNFAETFPKQKDYEKKKNYRSGALEWIIVAEESPKKIALEHILIVNPQGSGKDAIVKHWRQDWAYENTDLYVFDKDSHWKFKKLNPADVKGQWTQTVYQVDDAPRYSGSATWIHADGRTYWENTTDAPLPRREYKSRKDYNVLERGNHHEIYDWGWIHDQDNRKIVRKDGEKDVEIVGKKGIEINTKVGYGKCKIAQDYWKEYAPLWKAVRISWNEELSKNKDFSTLPNVEDIYLYNDLMKLTPTEEKEAKELVKKYIAK